MNVSLSSGPPEQSASPGTPAGDAFHRHFSEDERRALIDEDRAAQLGICAILAFLIGIGMLLTVLAVDQAEQVSQ